MYNAIFDTLIIAKKVVYLPSCHSTNDIAAELVREIAFQEGTIVITDEQSKGRGQRGTAWVTEPGQNLTLSVMLKPVFLSVHEQFYLSKAVAVGICNYLQLYTTRALIKWPNDIYISDKKVCGTSIENSIQGTTISTSIVGIGLNINQKTFSIPRATSLANEENSEFSLQLEFRKLAHQLDAAYHRLRSLHGRQEIDTAYLKNLYGFQQLRKYKFDNQVVAGKITGVSPAGMLCVAFENETKQFSMKEVEWVWED